MYAVVYRRNPALKSLKKLPTKDQERVKAKCDALASRPLAGKKLEGDLQDFYSLRVWPYRIIYRINEPNKVIEIMDIGHRQGIYK